MCVLRDVIWIASLLLGLVSFGGLCWFPSLHTNNLALPNLPEVEYIAIASCCSKLLWIVATLQDFSLDFNHGPWLCDGTSAISVVNNSMLHSKTKHIDIRFHFL